LFFSFIFEEAPKLSKFTNGTQQSTMASLTAATRISKTLPIPPKNPTKTHHCPQFLSFKHHKSVYQTRVSRQTAVRASSSNPSAATGSSPGPGLYSAQKFELTPQNVDLVLEDVRPYLIADGGNVDVVSVEDGVVSLQLQGFITFALYIFLELMISN
jgi:hypothetical protein